MASREERVGEAGRSSPATSDGLLLALTVALLGASVLTVHFGRGYPGDGAELLAWLALWISTAVGLARMESLTEVQAALANRAEREEELSDARDTLRLKGNQAIVYRDRSLQLDEFIFEMGNAVEAVRKRSDELQVSATRKGRLQKWSFLIGLTLLMVARAFPPIARLLGYTLLGSSAGS